MTEIRNPGLMVRQFGAAGDVIALEDCPVPMLTAGQVLVRLQRCAINPSDLITISGAYRSRTPLPFVGGFEGVGIVEAVSGDIAADSAGLRPGQRVLPIGSVGTWQTYKVMDAEWCFPLLPALSEEQAATSYINPMTAWLMLAEAADVTMKTRMAISAAGSAIGRMLIRLANARGIRPVAILRRVEARNQLDGLMLDDVISTDQDDCLATLRRCWHGQGPDLVFDAVGGKTGQAMIDALVPGGRMIHYGLLSGEPLGYGRPIRKDIRFDLFALRNWVQTKPKLQIAAALEQTARLVADGTLASPIAATYGLAEYRQAFAHNEMAHREGKILLRVAD